MKKLESTFDERGREIPDSRPLEMPAGLSRPPTIEEQIQRYVRGALSRMASEQGAETFEEADDLDDWDDDADDFLTPYEVHVMARELQGKDASNLDAPEPKAPGEENLLPAKQGGPSTPPASPEGNAAAGS